MTGLAETRSESAGRLNESTKSPPWALPGRRNVPNPVPIVGCRSPWRGGIGISPTEEPVRTKLLRMNLVAAATIAVLLAGPALAQAPYPTQTIKLIVPNPAGGLPDTIARVVGRRLQERVGQPVVIENRPGASAGIGTAALIGAPADGYTFLISDGAILTTNPLINAKLPYDPKQVVPFALVARAPLFLAVNTKVPAATLPELIAYAKANPGKLTYGSIGNGSFHHLSMEALKAALGLDITHVPFKGSGESVGALLGGHVDLLFSAYSGLRSGVDTKKIKLLASNGPKRSPHAPDVPAVSEFVPDYDLAVIQGLFARTGTPREVLQKIADELSAIVKEPEVVQQFGISGIEPVGGGPEDHVQALDREAERVAKVVKAAGIKAE
jgi:tripartite-type tricarboxylate transporter receptor subunit TctC